MSFGQSTDPHRLRNEGCPTPAKIGYSTRRAARKQLRKLRERYRQAPVSTTKVARLEAYRCECGAFHLGNRTLETRADEKNRRHAA